MATCSVDLGCALNHPRQRGLAPLAVPCAACPASATRPLGAPAVAGAVASVRSIATPVPSPAAARPTRSERSDDGAGAWEHWRLAGAAVACWALLLLAVAVDRLTAAPHGAVLALFATAYLAGGTFAAVEAGKDLLGRRVNVDLLMVVAALGAATVDAWAEGAVLLALFSSSNALEHHALGRTERAVRALMDLSPAVATVLRPGAPGGEAVVPVADLTLADTILVRPGERIAVDGVVTSGASTCDQAAITGESLPVGKRPGDPVFAGTINGTGALEVRVTRLATESTLAKIVAFVEEAQAAKSKTQRFTDAFEGKYAVAVIGAAAVAAVAPPLVAGVAWGDAFYRAMTLLVVASPCALVISTPAATLSALASAARGGVLFKGANHLEAVATVRTVAFDKTGTLTTGRPSLTAVVPLPGAGWDEAVLLGRAAAVERLSEHPLAEAVVAAARERGLAVPEVTGFRSVTGRGVAARIGDEPGETAVGGEGLFAELGIPVGDAARATADRLRDAGQTAIFVGDATGVRGVLAVADAVRPEAAAAVAALRRMGVRRTVMLTGDDPRVAAAVAAQVGIDEVRAGLLPEEKLVAVRELLAGGSVAMVGDGVNDAPALATATVGVAMGAAGTDVALETADVVLMADDLSRLPAAVGLARRTRRTIRQNLAFSLGVIALLVASTLSVGIPLPLGVVGHEGSTVLVVLNGLRLLRAGR